MGASMKKRKRLPITIYWESKCGCSMTVKQLNAFLQSHPTSLSSEWPLFVFITGASGAGKTHLAKALAQELDPEFVHIAYFDRIGVPSVEEMIKAS